MATLKNLKSVPVGVIDKELVLSSFLRTKISGQLTKCWQDLDCRSTSFGGYKGETSELADTHGTAVANLMAGPYPIAAGVVAYLSFFFRSGEIDGIASALTTGKIKADVINMSVGPVLDNIKSKTWNYIKEIGNHTIFAIAAGNGFPMRIIPELSNAPIILVGNIGPNGLLEYIEQISESQIVITSDAFVPADHATFYSKDAAVKLSNFDKWTEKNQPKQSDILELRKKRGKK
jgi:subtilisin family serine protease